MSITEFFQEYPLYFPSLVFLLGLIVGSFLNVVIYRLPVMMERDWKAQSRAMLELPEETPGETFNLAAPRSRCPHCKHLITAGENIPVVSFLLQGGKCRHCNERISIRYPVIELATALLSLLVAIQFGYNWLTPGILIFTWSLIVLTMIDFDHQLLPDDITLPLLWLGLGINATGFGLTDLSSAVWGAIAGYGILWSVYQGFKLLTGKEGMGFGDFKLLAALGAWMGWQYIPQIIMLSAFVGAFIGISLMVIKGRDKNIPIPYGPYLSAAGFIAMMWGNQINQFYFNYLG